MEIIVQGKGIEYFVPDEVKLNITFKTKEDSYENALSLGIKCVNDFVNKILLTNGFKKEDMKTRNFIIKEEKIYDEVTRKYLLDGFSFNQYATLKFDYNKEKIAKIMEELSKLDNPPLCQITFDVKNTKLCQSKVLSKAFEEAKIKAETIALAAGKELKKCIKIDFKPFTSEYISESNFGSDRMYANKARQGVTDEIVNTFTPEDIEVSETLYTLWIAE